MKKIAVFLALTSVLGLAACSGSTLVRNESNTECGRRLQSDRERCERNIQSSDEALAARRDTRDDSKQDWETRTLDRIKDTSNH